MPKLEQENTNSKETYHFGAGTSTDEEGDDLFRVGLAGALVTLPTWFPAAGLGAFFGGGFETFFGTRPFFAGTIGESKGGMTTFSSTRVSTAFPEDPGMSSSQDIPPLVPASEVTTGGVTIWQISWMVCGTDKR